ncbi:nucleotidyltransferase family protein [uncultured Stenotrophomonas sp.]|uniref:nucleotidyltransferase family protein n=1 Tax=uncultured Stenotrophomonas sp. TaxID=165438 RepID=UPI0028F0FF5E|nr:nucleotidyltransferase family protein [uncultured Stenotrophomonas sp.]
MTGSERVGHAVVVLAAGASARLGQPKQLLRIDGETLLHRVVRLARSTRPATLVVVLAPDANAVAEALGDQALTMVINPEPQRGMRSSLEVAAPLVAGFSHVLVVACDQPALEVAHLHALLRGAYNASSGCAGTGLASDGAVVLGVPAVVPGAWFDDLAGGGDDSGFRARLRALAPESVHVLEAPALALDIDTPDNLRTAQELGLIDPP